MCGDYFVAPVRINGEGPFPFLLDTGAGTTTVDPDVADDVGMGGRADLGIGALEVAGARVRESEMDALSVALGRRIDGILGHPVFGDYLMTYDFEGDQILLSEGALSSSDLQVIPTSDGTRPFVRADIAGESITVLIDTGSSRGLTLRDLDDYSFGEPVGVTGARMRVDGLHLVESGRLAGSVTLGPMVLTDPVVNASVSVDLIGQKYLANYNLTFDQALNLMGFEWIAPDPEGPIRTDPLRGTGVIVAPVGDIWQIIHVDPETEWESERLEVGDTITEMNGRLLADRSCPVPGADDVIREWSEYVAVDRSEPVRARVRELVR
jgi:hypothetical protein